jgi:hypothetical protein
MLKRRDRHNVCPALLLPVRHFNSTAGLKGKLLSLQRAGYPFVSQTDVVSPSKKGVR